MKCKSALLSCLMLVSIQLCYAHAIWIETNPTAKKSGTHIVKVFFGEYGENERDSVTNWFSDLKDLKLWLISPVGQKVELTTRDGGNHLASTFSPTTDGVYTVVISHIVKDIPGQAKIEYYATASVIAGAGKSVSNHSTLNTEVAILSDTYGKGILGKTLELQTIYQNKPSRKQKITMVSPGGWEKNNYTDEYGKTKIIPILPGIHMVEVMHNPKEPGEHNGKAYESTWKIATYCIYVEK